VWSWVQGFIDNWSATVEEFSTFCGSPQNNRLIEELALEGSSGHHPARALAQSRTSFNIRSARSGLSWVLNGDSTSLPGNLFQCLPSSILKILSLASWGVIPRVIAGVQLFELIQKSSACFPNKKKKNTEKKKVSPKSFLEEIKDRSIFFWKL